MDRPIAWYDPSNGVVSTDKDCPLFTPLGQVWALYPQPVQEPWPAEPVGHMAGGVQPSKITKNKAITELYALFGAPHNDDINLTRLNRLLDELIVSPQPEQEPVAVIDVHEFYDNCANFSLLQKLPKGKHTLYTTPKRPWVDLSDSQIEQVYYDVAKLHRGAPMPWGQVQFGNALQALIKEKNYD